MARFGTGNEAEVAKRIVRRECEKEGLNYDDVMKGRAKKKTSYENHNPWGYTSYTYSDFYTQADPFKSKQQTEQERKEQEKKTWDDLNRASRKAQEDFMRQQKERYAKYRTVTDFKDKHGTVWGISELVNLTRHRRLDLFDGEDPLSP